MRLLKLLTILQPIVRFRQRPRWVRPYLRDLYYRRLAQGPEPYRPRSVWSNWNWNAELSAFCHRINVQIPTNILTCALTDRSYSTLGISRNAESHASSLTELKNNTEYACAGQQLAQSYILAFLRFVYPRVPEDWIVDITNHLLSDAQLSFTSAYLGLKDLVLYADAPGSPWPNTPPTSTIMTTVMFAIVGALSKQNHNHALLFVRDFLLTPIVDMDVTGEIIVIENPTKLLTGILAAHNMAPAEPRLQWQSSMNNLLACYQVGIYSARELLGEAPGETLEIAEQEAACQAIRNLVGLSQHRPHLPLSGPLLQLDISPNAQKNVSLETYLQAASGAS